MRDIRYVLSETALDVIPKDPDFSRDSGRPKSGAFGMTFREWENIEVRSIRSEWV